MAKPKCEFPFEATRCSWATTRTEKHGHKYQRRKGFTWDFSLSHIYFPNNIQKRIPGICARNLHVDSPRIYTRPSTQNRPILLPCRAKKKLVLIENLISRELFDLLSIGSHSSPVFFLLLAVFQADTIHPADKGLFPRNKSFPVLSPEINWSNILATLFTWLVSRPFTSWI